VSAAPHSTLLGPTDPFWEKCARHQNKCTTRFVAHLFLCGPCAERLRHECFNDRPPLFEGLQVHGFCALCNKPQGVLLRQWFVCPICLGVVLSYPKTFAASQAVRAFWQGELNTKFPQLRLEERDVVQLEPFVPGRRNQKKKAESVSDLDFVIYDDGPSQGKPVFHIEMKSGPGSIEEMEQFQLDVNDSNDIANVCNKSGAPAYVFHVQVREEYKPPTRRSIAQGIWWVDCFKLVESLQKIKPRRGEEDKYAGYYSPSSFQPIDTFHQEMSEQRYLELRARLAAESLPIR